MSISKNSFKSFPPVAGILLIASSIQYLIMEQVAASAWVNPPYNFAVNFISDLGNPIPNDQFVGKVVNSPFHPMMNLGFITQGILAMAITLILWRLIPGRVRNFVLTLGFAHGAGIILVGTFHENSTVPLAMSVPHYLGAWAAIFGGNLIAIAVGVIGVRIGASGVYRVASIALGVIGIVSFAWLLADPVMLATQGGLLERIAVYTVLVWQLMTGVTLFLGRTKHGQAA